MLASGIIRKSNSPWASPIVIVPKKDGKGGLQPRMCIDYRWLNTLTVKNAYPILLITSILQNMPPTLSYFSTFDLYMGYNQIRMDQDAITKSAFITPEGHYEYLRMPFGLCNAPATFQQAMNEILGDMIGKELYVYIDDVTIFSTTFEGHLRSLRKFLECLRKHCFFLKPKKCYLAMHEVELLGHLITREGIRPSPNKVKAVWEYPRPTNRNELLAFLRLVGYYRNFIGGFSTLAQLISKMLRKDVPFKWDKNGIEEETFIKIKEALIGDCLLICPNYHE